MIDIFQYLLKWSIALAVVFLFYRFVLRPLTFYQWNRRYLILYTMAAFFIPFVNLYSYVQPEKLQGIKLVQYIPVINIENPTGTTVPLTNGTPSISPMLIAALLMAAGSLFLLVRLVMQWYSLRNIRKRAVKVYHPEANVYHVDEHVIPFSFGNSIYLNTALHSEQELNDIILHEFVHVRQKHSFDIIWSEILCILNWYNPFAWFIRQAIRQNLEFIADQAVLKNGLDKKTYQYHLLKVIGSPQYSIANNFNFSSLKKRIAMMNRLKSARVHMVKFLFALPLLAVLLLAFRNNVRNDGWFKHDKSDTTKRPLLLIDGPVTEITFDDLPTLTLKEFYKKNPSVKEVAWSDEDEIIIYLRNGRREAYLLEHHKDMARLVRNYGGIPTVLSPLTATLDVLPPMAELAEMPPLEADADAIILDEMISDDADADLEIVELQLDNLEKFYKRNPQVAAVSWSTGRINIKRKDGTKESYKLSDDNDMERFERKYGELPIAPPPPPAEPSLIEIAVEGKPLPRNDVSLMEVVVEGKPSRPVDPSLVEVIVEGKQAPSAVKSIEQHGDNIIIKLKNGKEETYRLLKPAEKEALERKYGPVIEIKGTRVEPASVTMVDGERQNALLAEEIVIHGGEPQWNVKPKQETIDEAVIAEHARIANVLYVGIDNPINIKVEGVPEQELMVIMTGGKIEKRGTKWYARCYQTGNTEIQIFRKTPNGPKLLNKRAFRVEFLPNPAKLKPTT